MTPLDRARAVLADPVRSWNALELREALRGVVEAVPGVRALVWHDTDGFSKATDSITGLVVSTIRRHMDGCWIWTAEHADGGAFTLPAAKEAAEAAWRRAASSLLAPPVVTTCVVHGDELTRDGICPGCMAFDRAVVEEKAKMVASEWQEWFGGPSRQERDQ